MINAKFVCEIKNNLKKFEIINWSFFLSRREYNLILKLKLAKIQVSNFIAEETES